MSRHYTFFNFVATLKKYSRKEVETGIVCVQIQLLIDV